MGKAGAGQFEYKIGRIFGLNMVSVNAEDLIVQVANLSVGTI